MQENKGINNEDMTRGAHLSWLKQGLIQPLSSPTNYGPSSFFPDQMLTNKPLSGLRFKVFANVLNFFEKKQMFLICM